MHTWAATGVYDNGELCAPCTDPQCEAEARRKKNGRWVISPTGFGTTINGIKLDIEDDVEGGVAKVICREVAQVYAPNLIDFQPGDVVLDIGAHVGIVSIYLAKQWPGLRIYAYEPVLRNFQKLLRNIWANDVQNVKAHPLAVSSDGRALILTANLHQNSGGATAFAVKSDGTRFTAESLTLAQIFVNNNINRCRLLKLDCEGAEHEILNGNPQILDRVDYLCGEFHINAHLEKMGHSIENLLTLCRRHMQPDHIMVSSCRMSE